MALADTFTPEVVKSIQGKTIYLSFQPDYLDFTSSGNMFIKISTKEFKIDIPLPTDWKTFVNFISEFKYFISDCKIITWNIKSFYSYVLGKTGKSFEFENCSFYDLAILESYTFGKIDSKPLTFGDALDRLIKLVSGGHWDKTYKIYQMVHLPLITKVIPEMETTPLSNKNEKQLVYSCYDLYSGKNGRLKTIKGFVKCYIPHAMSPDDKKALRIPNYDESFMYFDFNHMEVSVIQWLSKDPVLGSILASNEDLYKGIWRLISGFNANDKQREYAKMLFLPVVYGMGSKTLAEEANIDIEKAESIINKIYKTFPTVISWVKSTTITDEIAVDYFGKHRKIDKNIQSRNFSVQSPASLICLYKLCLLRDKINNLAKFVFHLHDGYCIITNDSRTRQVYEIVNSVLTSEDDLSPGLKMKTSCYVGKTLDSLKIFKG